jgi:hypothetical protein
MAHQTHKVMKSHQARAFAENSLKSCDSCNLIGPAHIAAVPEIFCRERIKGAGLQDYETSAKM